MRWLVYLIIILGGALLFSQAIAQIGLDPMPGDLAFKVANTEIVIPVLYSLGAVAIAGLIIWAVRR